MNMYDAADVPIVVLFVLVPPVFTVMFPTVFHDAIATAALPVARAATATIEAALALQIQKQKIKNLEIYIK